METTACKIAQGELDFSCDDEGRIKQALQQLAITHRNDDGWITVGIKPSSERNSWSQYHLKLDELRFKLSKFLDVQNVYISQNSFFIPQRTVLTIRKLNALYVDLDFHHVAEFRDLKPEQMMGLLEDEGFTNNLPRPSFILSTGEGLAIIWLLEPVPVKALPLWQACEKYFVHSLKEYGADPAASDAARVLRLSGTWNSGSNTLAYLLKIYDLDNIYTLKEIQNEYLPELKPWTKIANNNTRHTTKIGHLYNIYTLHWTRVQDLLTLQNLRASAGQMSSGHRELMCFLVRYWMSCFTGDSFRSLQEAIKFNEGFLDPLSPVEVEKATASAEKGWQNWLSNFDDQGNLIKGKKGSYWGYNYKNDTLIDLLSITREEQKFLKTIISKEEKQRRDTESTRASRRNSEGMTRRQASKQYKANEVDRLISEGLKPKEVAKALDCSTRYIYQLMKELN